jgi:predicted lipid-binding transport protein (Tim44 family)
MNALKSIIATLSIAVFTLGSLAYMSDADAKKRFGGGKSSGMQRDSVTKNPTPPPAQPAAPAAGTPGATPAGAPAAAAAAAPAAAAAKTGASKWLGPLAGIAAGGLLAAMFFGGAFDGIKFFDIILMIMLAVGVFFIVRMFLAKKAQQMGSGGNSSNASGPNSMQYAGVGGASNPTEPAPRANPVAFQPSQPAQRDANGRIVAPEIGSALSTANASPEVINAATASPRIPADFDVAPFERNAKASFIRLQAANDTKDLADIRDFTTPEMYGEIALQMQERGDAKQHTEVVSVDARVIEVVIENQRAVASVRFTGVIREDNEGAEGFDEVWHVMKDLSNENGTWKLAGIQQLQ